MANHYRSVLASGGGVQPTGDAVAADVLTGKTFSNANAVGISGTMPNRGAVSGQATPSQPYTIPAGYHNGSGVVTAAGGDAIPLNSYATTAYISSADSRATSFTNTISTNITGNPTYNALLINVKNKNSLTITKSGSGEAYIGGYLIGSDGTCTFSNATTMDLTNVDYLLFAFYTSGSGGYNTLTFT